MVLSLRKLLITVFDEYGHTKQKHSPTTGVFKNFRPIQHKRYSKVKGNAKTVFSLYEQQKSDQKILRSEWWISTLRENGLGKYNTRTQDFARKRRQQNYSKVKENEKIRSFFQYVQEIRSKKKILRREWRISCIRQNGLGAIVGFS